MTAAGVPMMLHPVLRGSLGLALSVAVFAQGRGTPPPGGGGTVPPSPGGSIGTGTRGNTTTFPGTQPNTYPEMAPRPLFLSGKVVMEDGTPPPEPVVIQIVCRATPRSIAYTDSKGSFSADLNDRNSAVFADASEPSTDGLRTTNSGIQARSVCPGQMNLMGAQLQASLAGFRSDVVDLAARHSLDNPDVGTMVLHRLANVEGLTISATSALAPKDAKKALEKARNDTVKQKWQDAQKELEKAVAIYPKYAAAWLALGNVQQQQKNLEGARQSYAQALAADSKFVSPYLELASISAGEQKWPDVADQTDRLLRLNPVDFPQAWFLNAMANYYLGKKEVAEKSAREGVSRDPGHRIPRLNYVLGILLAQKQDYAASAENLRDYMRYAPHAADLDEVKKQLAEVEKALGPEAKKQ
ncbi:MAG TPA: tetratricopeptide repeat protein [Bryobacteraceae bacterium]|nr:tetratricopeptide repeat protein [Bryobacteraceae bacterium]